MSNLTALIADDSEEMRMLLSNALEQLNVDVVVQVDNGNAVLEQLDQVQPQICFLDIDMPGISGLELLDEFQKIREPIYAVIVSGHNSVKNVKAAISKGAKGFVVKPYTLEKIKEVVDRYNKNFDIINNRI